MRFQTVLKWFEKYINSYDPSASLVEDEDTLKFTLDAENSPISVEELPFPTEVTYIYHKDEGIFELIMKCEISKGRKLTVNQTYEKDMHYYPEMKSVFNTIADNLYRHISSDAEFQNSVKKLL